jgi:gamma-glutamyltranspeptidase/glutathione hydrolase
VGEIARAIAADFEATGGHITLDDLRGYRAQAPSPLVSGFRDWSVHGTPPPCGGVMVGQMLRILERHPPAATQGEVAQLRLLVEAM